MEKLCGSIDVSCHGKCFAVGDTLYTQTYAIKPGEVSPFRWNPGNVRKMIPIQFTEQRAVSVETGPEGVKPRSPLLKRGRVGNAPEMDGRVVDFRRNSAQIIGGVRPCDSNRSLEPSKVPPLGR
ncbi:hypothetical protein ABIE52_000114 [Rhodococcus sp. OAS809]